MIHVGLTEEILNEESLVSVWELSTGRCVRQLKGHEGSISDVELSKDGKLAISVEGQIALVSTFTLSDEPFKELMIIDLKTGQLIHTLPEHTTFISTCAIDQVGKVGLSGSTDGMLRVWDISERKCLFILKGHQSRVNCCALSRNGQTAFSGAEDMTLRVWNTNTGQCLHLLHGHTGSIQGCALSIDGQHGLSIDADNTICLWNISTGTLLHKVRSNIELAEPCALNVDGRVALYVAPSRTIRLVELETEREITAFTFDSNINSVAFSLDNVNIMASDVAGHVHFLYIEQASRGSSDHV